MPRIKVTTDYNTVAENKCIVRLRLNDVSNLNNPSMATIQITINEPYHHIEQKLTNLIKLIES